MPYKNAIPGITPPLVTARKRFCYARISVYFFFLFFLPFTVAASPLSYHVAINGVKDHELSKALEYSADTITLKKKPPATMALLRLRVKDDTRRFHQLLDSMGYYAAEIKSDINDKTQPIAITFTVTLGEAFVFSPVTIINNAPSTPLTFPSATTLGLATNTRAEAKTILTAQEKLLRSIQEQGFPFAEVKEPAVTVDHSPHHVAVEFRTNPGKMAFLGPTTISGLETVDQAFIYNKIPWKEGERYTPVLTEKYDKILNDTGLFALVEIKKPDTLDNEGHLPVRITVKERKPRTVKAGVNYQTNEGPGVKLLWQHRNLFHRGEQLEAGGSASPIKRDVHTNFTRYDFLRKDQTLKAFYELSNEDTDAYFSNNMTVGSAIERKLANHLTGGLGASYKLSHVKQSTDNENFGLVSFPLYSLYDSRDNSLDPAKGTNASVQLTPFLNTLSTNANFTKEYGSLTHYLPLSESFTLAGRTALGLIQSPSTHNVPPDERFYAGGSGSVRGYGFQRLGPLTEGKPDGGRSLLELSGELRYRASPKIGLVAFVDGGNSYDNMVPDMQNGIYWGAGAGIRYYTSFAPIRFDIGVPLNNKNKDSLQQSVQVYVSLGQAF